MKVRQQTKEELNDCWQFSLRSLLLFTAGVAVTFAWAASHRQVAIALGSITVPVSIITLGLTIGKYFCARVPGMVAALCAIAGTISVIGGILLGASLLFNDSSNRDIEILWIWVSMSVTIGLTFYYAAFWVLKHNQS